MPQFAETVILAPEEEAARLWKGALDAFGDHGARAGTDLVFLCEALDLGIRAAEILVIQRLQPVRHDFPATVGLLLETPVAEVDAHRDSVAMQRSLELTDIIDLLSEEPLDCVSPGLHRGWEDRRFACERSRKTARRAVGLTLSELDREHLLLLSAYRNRIFRTPPPVRILADEVVEGFASLEKLVEALL